MGFTDSALDDATNGVTAVITAVSLHSADPGTTGANETSAGRQTPTFAAASGSGDAPLTAALAFTGGAASGACTHYGLWAGAVFKGGFPLTGDQTFNAAGEYTVDNITVNATAT